MRRQTRSYPNPSVSTSKTGKPRIAFVVQRYGPEITGGSEFLCQAVATRLVRWYQVEVITTCAKDYRTWKNEFSAGRGFQDGVMIYRFPTIQERDINAFNEHSKWLFSNPHTVNDEIRWLNEQGPVCPDLIAYLEKHGNEYDAVVFFTYLYYPTYYGLKVCGPRKILIPTAHDEPPLRLQMYHEVMQQPAALIFNSEAEKRLVLQRFSVQDKPHRIAGIGVHVPRGISPFRFPRSQGFDRPYIIFGGRIDEGKNAHQLVDYYNKFMELHPNSVYLVLFGQLAMKLPSNPNIVYYGFVTEQKKWEIIRGAAVSVIPSHLESLSILALESLALGVPILTNAQSPVLKELAERSNGGLYYNDFNEFEVMLEKLLREPRLRYTLGRQGRHYVLRNYTWRKVLKDYRAMIEIARKSK